MQVNTFLIALFGLLACTFAQSSVHKVDLWDQNGSPRIDAVAKNGAQFNADVHSKADVDANVRASNGNSRSWQVGAGANNANAGSNTARKNGNDVMTTDQNGRQSMVDVVDSNSAVLKGASGKTLTLDASPNSETAVDNSGRRWSANKTGNTWTAKGAAGKTAVISNINDQSNVRLTGPNGKQYVASQVGNRATLQDASNRLNSWTAEQQTSGSANSGLDKTTIYKSSIPIYSTSVDKGRKAVILTDPTGRVNIAECQIDEYKDDNCPENRFNDQFDTKNEFSIDKDSVSINLVPKVNESGHIEYEFPGCFDISMEMLIPPNINVKDLAAQLEIAMPDGLTFVCPDQYNCLPQKCIYTKLCKSTPLDPAKVAVDWGFSKSTNNACQNQQGRRLPFSARVCPPDAKFTKDPKYQAFTKQLNLFGSVKSDIQVTMKLYVMKAAVNNCPDLFINSKLQLVGCRQGKVSYTVRVFGQELLSANEAIARLMRGGGGLFGSQAAKEPTTSSNGWMSAFGGIFGGGK